MARIKCYLHVSVSSLYVKGLTKKKFQVRSPMNLDKTQAPVVINMYFSHKKYKSYILGPYNTLLYVVLLDIGYMILS